MSFATSSVSTPSMSIASAGMPAVSNVSMVSAGAISAQSNIASFATGGRGGGEQLSSLQASAVSQVDSKKGLLQPDKGLPDDPKNKNARDARKKEDAKKKNQMGKKGQQRLQQGKGGAQKAGGMQQGKGLGQNREKGKNEFQKMKQQMLDLANDINSNKDNQSMEVKNKIRGNQRSLQMMYNQVKDKYDLGDAQGPISQALGTKIEEFQSKATVGGKGGQGKFPGGPQDKFGQNKFGQGGAQTQNKLDQGGVQTQKGVEQKPKIDTQPKVPDQPKVPETNINTTVPSTPTMNTTVPSTPTISTGHGGKF